jgi:hypothetical protein
MALLLLLGSAPLTQLAMLSSLSRVLPTAGGCIVVADLATAAPVRVRLQFLARAPVTLPTKISLPPPAVAWIASFTY